MGVRNQHCPLRATADRAESEGLLNDDAHGTDWACPVPRTASPAMTWTAPQHDRELELRDHAPEAQWRVAIREIAARHGAPSTHGDACTPFSSGSDVVWSVGDLVVKLTAPMWRDEIDAEVRNLERVAGRLSVATPEVRAHGELDGWPYVVMTRVPGVSVGSIWAELPHAERLRLAGDLGRLTAELHGLEVLPEPDPWAPFWRRCLSNVAERHGKQDVSPTLVAEIDPFLARVVETGGELDDQRRAHLHTEILDEHVLVQERAGRWELCSMIDFADGRVGPPEYEFPAPVEFLFRGEAGLLRAYLTAYGLPESQLTGEYSQRLLAWGLCHQFGSLARMVRAAPASEVTSLPELARLLYRVD